MNLVYFGSPEFSAEILESIIKNTSPSSPSPYQGEGRGEVVAVVTSPDKPTGRKQLLVASPVAQMATKYDLPVFKPIKLDTSAKGRSAFGRNLAHLKLLKPDIFLVVSYGQFIPQSWLDPPTLGCYNIHFSLLPKYRGALCISEAIKNQDEQTGVTLIKMDDKLDHGPIIAQSEVAIDIEDNVASLTTKLTQAAIKLLKTQLPLITANNHKLQTISQDDSLATYTPLIKSRTRESAFIPWEKISSAPAAETHALIRSLNPDPGAWTKIRIKEEGESGREIELKIIKTTLKKNLSLNTYTLTLESVQLPGKKPISWQQYTSGHR